MELNNNPNQEFEYTGPPKNQDFGGIVLLFVLSFLSFCGAYYYNSKFEAYENGATLDIYSEFQGFYEVFGKWSVLLLFLAPAIILLYIAIKKYVKYKKTEYIDC